MTNVELNRIIEKHEKWLKNLEDGERANLRGADLRGADLYGADLRDADLRDVDLRGADLRDADLRDANLRDTDLRGADLYGADLRDANLRGADLRGANLYGAKNVPYIPMACPDDGSFIGWKKASGYIVKLQVPEDARRSSATRRKCRCNKAVVLAIENVDGSTAEVDSVASDHDPNFVYRVNYCVSVDDFCEDRFKECAPESISLSIGRKRLSISVEVFEFERRKGPWQRKSTRRKQHHTTPIIGRTELAARLSAARTSTVF